MAFDFVVGVIYFYKHAFFDKYIFTNMLNWMFLLVSLRDLLDH